MKKIILSLAAILTLSCAKNPSQNNNEDLNPSPFKPVPPKPDPIDPTPPEENPIINVNFGTDGLVVLNKETGEYTIKNLPTSKPDVDFLQPSKGFFDSFVNDPIYIYRSSIFPVDKYSLFKIPDILTFDTVNSKDGKPSHGKLDSHISFWGRLGNSTSKGYFACYRSVDNKYAKFEFMVEALNDQYIPNDDCKIYRKMIDNNEIKASNVKAGDIIMLKFYGFRFYSDGISFNDMTSIVSFNAQIKYHISTK